VLLHRTLLPRALSTGTFPDAIAASFEGQPNTVFRWKAGNKFNTLDADGVPESATGRRLAREAREEEARAAQAAPDEAAAAGGA
jgi:hypothetical protein